MSTPPARDNPYGAFKFRIKWDDRYIAGASLITGIEPATAADLKASGSAGHFKHGPVILQGIVTRDPDFVSWAQLKASTSPEPAADDDPRRIVVEQYTGDSLHATYTLYRCWVSDFQALPDLDANASMVAIELVQLEHEGVHVRPGG